MQNLFWHSKPWKGLALTHEQTSEAIQIYKRSNMMSDVHDRIRQYTMDQGLLQTFGREEVITKIMELLKEFKVDPNAFKAEWEEVWDFYINNNTMIPHFYHPSLNDNSDFAPSRNSARFMEPLVHIVRYFPSPTRPQS